MDADLSIAVQFLRDLSEFGDVNFSMEEDGEKTIGDEIEEFISRLESEGKIPKK